MDWFNITGNYISGSGITQGLFAAGIAFFVIFAIALYLYNAIAWQDIGKKQKYKYPWLAWIPFANISMVLEMGEFHWAWVFLVLIPILGWIALLVLSIISMWRIFEKQHYPGWFSLSVIIPQIGGILYMIAIGFVAWGRRMNGYGAPQKRSSSRKRR